MRTMYDSVTSGDIPIGVEMVAGYVDGLYAWSDADWLRHHGSRLVSIAVLPTTLDAQVLDVETGNATPVQAALWGQQKWARGETPSIYVQQSVWSEVAAEFDVRSIPRPQWWIADWNNSPDLFTGTVAHQYANPTLTGHHYDLSAVADYWPGVDPAPTPTPTVTLPLTPTLTLTLTPALTPAPPLDQARAAWARLGDLLVNAAPQAVIAIEAAITKIRNLP